MASESSHQTQLKNAAALLEHLYGTQTVPADVATITAATAGSLADLKLAVAKSFRTSVAQAVALAQSVLAVQVVDYSREITKKPDFDALVCLGHLYDRFVSQNLSVESRGFTYGTPTTFGSSKGELKRLTVDANGFAIENTHPEVRTVKCVQAQGAGARRFAEVMRISGEAKGLDILEVLGSGAALNFTVASALNSLLSNPGFTSYSFATAPSAGSPSTGTSPDTITNWSVGSITGLQLDVDTVAQALPGVASPTSVLFTTNNSLTQLLSAGGAQVNAGKPYQFGLWVRREGNCDGTLTLNMGSTSKAITVSGLTGDTWTWVELDYDEGLWPINWLGDQPSVSAVLTSRTTGQLRFQNPWFGPLVEFDGLFYHLPTGTAPHVLDDSVSATDTIASDSVIQKLIVYAFGRYLPHRASVTFTASGGETLTFTASSKLIQRSGGSWDTDGFAVGMPLTVAGTSGNNGNYTIATIAGQNMTVVEALADEGPLSSTATVSATPSITDPS